MLILLYAVHILIALALIGVVLLQKSEGGALGMGGGGMSGFMTGRSTANLLTRTTAILAAAFFATSILLVVLSNYSHAPRSLSDRTRRTPNRPPAWHHWHCCPSWPGDCLAMSGFGVAFSR